MLIFSCTDMLIDTSASKIVCVLNAFRSLVTERQDCVIAIFKGQENSKLMRLSNSQLHNYENTPISPILRIRNGEKGKIKSMMKISPFNVWLQRDPGFSFGWLDQADARGCWRTRRLSSWKRRFGQ